MADETIVRPTGSYRGYLRAGTYGVLRLVRRSFALLIALAAAACFFALPAEAWAQTVKETVEGQPRSTAPNWLMILLLTVLAMLAICKPSHRADEPKPKYE